ncbi:MAG: CotH kinase family protein, partial [Planctomycetes bacterium]|nr:CotH kinase family protein [Planctomycetota bacterium]
LIDAAEWARFFAVMACLNNIDGGIWNNNGEDFFLYRVPADSARPDAGKWLIVPWDLEESFGDSEEQLFRPTVPSIVRFLTEPRFARLYYEELDIARRGAFSRAEMQERFGHAAVMFPAAQALDVIADLDQEIAERHVYLDANLPDRLEGGPRPPGEADLVIDRGDVWKFFRGRSDPPGGSPAWTLRGYDDSGWESGPTGIGYGDGDDATVLDDMEYSYSTVFARRAFVVDDPALVRAAVLRVDYDDAYVAYVNGVEVARSASAPSDAVIHFDMLAEDAHEALGGGGGDPEDEVDISFAIGDLRAGDNVLAIVVLNASLGSSDLSLIPRLSISTEEGWAGVTGGCGDLAFASDDHLRLEGRADAAATGSVTVDGALADFSYITGGAGPYGAIWSADVSLDPGWQDVRIEARAGEGGTGPVVDELTIAVLRDDSGAGTAAADIAEDAVWTAGGGPYRIAGAVDVAPGARLTIQPGAVLLFARDAALVVRGTLIARGTRAEPIDLRAQSCEDPWGGIALLDTGAQEGPLHELAFCRFQGGRGPAGFTGVVSCENARARIESCTFAGAETAAVAASGASLEILSTEFRDVPGGVRSSSSALTVRGSTFFRLWGDGDAISIDRDGSGRSIVDACVFADLPDDAVDIVRASADILGCDFARVAGRAISIAENGSLGDCTLRLNLLFECSTGLALSGGAQVDDAHHITIAGCTTGIEVLSPAAGQATMLALDSSIVWNNDVPVILDGSSALDFTFSDIEWSVWPGPGNISADPMFVGGAASDLSLLPGSPCIGTGRDQSDMGARAAGSGTTLFVRGDSNESGIVDLSDAVSTLLYLYLGGGRPACLDRSDANDDGVVDISDAVFTLNYLFLGGKQIPPPYPEPGIDPTPDQLDCP